MKNRAQFLIIPPKQDNKRLDNFLLYFLRGVPKSRVYRMIRSGEVRVNKGRCGPESRIRSGDMVRIPPVYEKQSACVYPVPKYQDILKSSVLYSNPDFMIINKPAGLAVHGGSGLKTGLIEQLRLTYPQETSLELVHRLDKDTSGCLLISKKNSVLRLLHEQLRQRSIDKKYLAFVEGRWPNFHFDISAPIARHKKGGERIMRVSNGGKISNTRVKILKKFNDCSLLQLQPVTGRTHQIRVHCSFYGHPVVGDSKYQNEDQRQIWEKKGISQLCLHSYSLKLKSLNGQDLSVYAPLPKHFFKLMHFLDSSFDDLIKVQ